MKIIAHRGFWLTPEEKNTSVAFQRSIQQGFGIETDIRDHLGELVVCHDVPAKDEEPLSFNSFLEMYRQNADNEAVLAINIKSDGLHNLLSAAVKKHQLDSYFAFDMSFPGMFFNYKNSGIKFFTSVNEYIQKPILLQECSGIWLDAYSDIWYNIEMIQYYLKNKKKVCIVSPELHNREHYGLWNEIKDSKIYEDEGLLLCTDFPQKARMFFS